MNTLKPLVSVAIVCYNQKDYVQECLQSIFDQDYDNLQIVIADDGSTDGTLDAARALAVGREHQFVFCQSEVNQGITRNHNRAFFACTGKYIAWMGGDDLMLPNKIRKQVEFMEAHPQCSICYHNLEVFESATGCSLGLFNSQADARSGDIVTMVKHGTFNGACSSMVRRSACPPHGFDVRIPIASDWLFWVETLAGGGRIEYIDHVLGRYRRHMGNVTALKTFACLEDHLASCALISAKWPFLHRAVRHRQSEIFYSMARTLPGKKGYYAASVAYYPSLKSCARALRGWLNRRI